MCNHSCSHGKCSVWSCTEDLEDLDDALRAAADAKRLFGELDDKQGEAEASESMVAAYAALGQGDKAIQSAKEAAAGFAATKCIQRQAAATQLAASLHQQMEDLKTTLAAKELTRTFLHFLKKCPRNLHFLRASE